MSSLADFQDAFAHALVADTPGNDGFACQPGFSVYRNTVLKGCIDTLRFNFPTVATLVGEPWFQHAAAVYARRDLPQDARLLFYGEGFPDFLAHLPEAAELPYLSGVARLDRFWIESHTAADDAAQDPSTLLALPLETLGRTVIRPRASARWQWFADVPVYTIWCANREATQVGDPAWRGEGGLIVRNRGRVEWREASKAHCAFLDACAAGHTLANAARAALDADPHADVGALISILLGAGALRATSDETSTS